MKRDRFLVESPERIQFWREVAESGTRAAAFLADTFLQVLGFLIVVLAAGGLSALSEFFAGGALSFLIILLFLLQWGYGFFFELLLSGRSPGKLIFRLRVVRLDGEPLDARALAVRNILRAADGLPAMIAPLLGGFVSIADPYSRRLGDLAAGTVVIKDARRALVEPSTDGQVEALPSAWAAEAVSAANGARLGEEELYVIRRFLVARSAMPPARADETARVLAGRVALRLGIEVGADPVSFLEGVYLGQSL